MKKPISNLKVRINHETNTIYLAIVLSLTVAKSGFAADSYLCNADKVTDFKYNKSLDKWERTNFNVDDRKYIMTKSDEEGKVWIVKVFGTENSHGIL